MSSLYLHSEASQGQLESRVGGLCSCSGTSRLSGHTSGLPSTLPDSVNTGASVVCKAVSPMELHSFTGSQGGRGRGGGQGRSEQHAHPVLDMLATHPESTEF